jgi:peptide/nickel transport system permease protein
MTESVEHGRPVTVAATRGKVAVKSEGGWRRNPFIRLLGRLWREKPLGAIGGILVLLALLAGLLADLLAPYGYAEAHFTMSLRPPSAEHWLGTDYLGRDLFSRLLYGARVSLTIAVCAVVIGMAYATALGLLAAWFGGWVDMVISRIVDTKMVLPGLLLMLVISAVLGPGLLNMVIVLSLFGVNESRVVRAQALAVKENLYIEAAQALGSPAWRIILRDVLPNVAVPILILATLRFGTVIISEASLSFLGFGIPAPYPSWGRMLGQESMNYMVRAPWLVLVPGIALTLTVWGFNILGDALRDLLDPRQRHDR